jgi:hypothetical protein
VSALVQFVSCKICKAQVEIPPLPPILGEDPDQKAGRIAVLQAGTIVVHLAKEHKEMRDHSLAWASMFSEFYFGSMFDLSGCQVLQDQYDAKRLLLLGLCQRSRPETEEFPGHPATPEVAAYYEETERIAELEKAGYRITRGFLGAASGERIVKVGG